ncbi:hypothetical protein NC653_038371 [Populus alba x Populus x berolinensis]|uniref:Uncharacterized protein n=1 Tax=Populus alba x Populus x berolinensis TaxID=444605 RepID=A0AAD6LGN5_9ROSI|nr:hypothetical protein NC653_038371 [Populus alba x Populus x berolinensis]
MPGPDLLLEAIVVLRVATTTWIKVAYIESVPRNLSPNGQFTTKSARELIRFKGNKLNGRSCHRGLFIFQSMCSFSNEDCDHLFMKNLTKVHEKHILTNLPNNKVQKSQFDSRDPSMPFLPCNHLLSPCASGTFEI